MVWHDASEGGACQALLRLLRQTPRIGGLLLGRAVNAPSALTHLLRIGIRVPGDIALLFWDDDPYLEFTDPTVARAGTRPGQFAGALALIMERFAQGSALAGEVRLPVPDLKRGETME